MRSIKCLPISDRPRERLISLGPKALSDPELVSILLSSGSAGSDVSVIAEKVIRVLDAGNLEITIDDLVTINGIGKAKAAIILAALELSRRRISPDGVKIKEPQDIIPLVTHLADRKQETFICVSLSGAHEVIASRIVTIGLANVCQVHPREVFADPLMDRACSVIVAHNHPSGDLTPSSEDFKVTERLKSCAALLGIKFLDHIIFSKRGFYSFQYSDQFVNGAAIINGN